MPRDYKSRSRRNEPEEREGPSAIVWLFIGILIGLIISGIFYLRAQHKNTAPTANNTPAKHLIANKHITPKKQAPVDAATQANANKPANNSAENLQTQFDFYNVLPQKTAQQAPLPTQQPTQQSTQQPAQQPAQQTMQQQQPTPQPAVLVKKPVETPVSSPASSTQQTQSAPIEKAEKTEKPEIIEKVEKTEKIDQTTDVDKTAQKPGNYIIQIAALSKSSDADQLKAQLVLLGFDVNLTPIKKNGQLLQRVWLGPFANKDDAAATQKQLLQNQISSLLLKSVA